MSCPFPSPGEVSLVARLLDKPDRASSRALRKETRPTHRAWLKESHRVFLGGPVLGDDAAPVGSLLALSMQPSTAGAADVDLWLDADPYAQAGLFAAREVLRWKLVVGVDDWAPAEGEKVTVIMARDKVDGVDGVRARTRPDHLRWWAESGKSGFVGPILEEGDVSVGSMFVLLRCAKDDAAAWHATDPYISAGLFASVDIFEVVVGIAEGELL